MSVEFTNEGTLRVTNPANLEVIGEVKLSNPGDAIKAVKEARLMAHSWNERGLSKRLDHIDRFRQVIRRNADQIAQLITSETGKPVMESLVEVFAVMETCAWLKKNAPRVLKREKVNLNPLLFAGKHSYNVFEPLGVVAVISPWNFPFSISLTSTLMALACGNTVVLKPSPKTPLIGERIQQLFRQAGFPSDVVTVLQGDKEIAAELVLSDVGRVVFTGGTEGGKAIMALAALKLHPLTLELGGKHPAIVLEDVDVDKVARAIVWASFMNAGQACASIERLYVLKPVAAKLSKAIVGLTKDLRLGNGMSSETDIGPLIDAGQLDRIQAQVDQAVSMGARILAGGRARPELGGYFFEPTVLADVTDDMDVMRQEIFGPILPIIVVDDESDAVRAANNSSLALGASIWTADLNRGEEMASRIQSGMIWVNDALYSHISPDAPWGGLKNSGFGRSHSAHSLLEFVNIKHIGVDKQGTRDWTFPYSKDAIAMMKDATAACHEDSLKARLSALSRLVTDIFHVRKNKS